MRTSRICHRSVADSWQVKKSRGWLNHTYDFRWDHNLWLSVESHLRIFIGFSKPHLRTSSSGSHTRGSLETATADSLCCTLGALPKADHPTLVMINHNAERLWTPQPGNKPTWLACFVRRMADSAKTSLSWSTPKPTISWLLFLHVQNTITGWGENVR